MTVGLLAERDVIRAVQDRTDDKYLATRPESAQLMGGSDPPIREPLIKEWLDKTIAGPYNGNLASFVQKISHVGDREVTFPGAQVPLPPQLVLALVAWLQGQILAVMGQVCDVATVSAASAAWMNQLMLQLGIILEPRLTEPKVFCSSHTWRPPSNDVLLGTAFASRPTWTPTSCAGRYAGHFSG